MTANTIHISLLAFDAYTLVLILDGTILRTEHTVLESQLRSEFQSIEVDIWHNTQIEDRNDDSQAKQPFPANMRLKPW